MTRRNALILLLIIYVAAAVVAVYHFTPDRLPSQLAGWVGGLTLGLLVVLYRERNN